MAAAFYAHGVDPEVGGRLRLMFPPGWKATAIAWIVVRIVLVAVGFWLDRCPSGSAMRGP